MRYNIPQIIFLNKMDKAGADFNNSIESIKEKLGCVPLSLQLPIGQEKDFRGIIDLIDMTKYVWDQNNDEGMHAEKMERNKDKNLFDDAMTGRINLLEQLANHDDKFGELFLQDSELTRLQKSELVSAIRRVTLSGDAVPVLCGSSLQNRAIQQLLDAIVLFLPDPLERKYAEFKSDDFCSLAFKTIHNKQKIPVTFLRIFSGVLTAGSNLYNINKSCNEKVEKLYQVNANEYKEIRAVTKGNIAAVIGLKQVKLS